MASSHDHTEDPRNSDVLVWLNGALVPRAEAVVSVLDAGFLMGDEASHSFQGVGAHRPVPEALEPVVEALLPAWTRLSSARLSLC